MSPAVQSPARAADASAARAALRGQIARLEARLAAVPASTYPHVVPAPVPAPPPRGPRLLGLGDLERLRDALVARLADAECAAAEQAQRQAHARERLAAMLADPPSHRWDRVDNRDLGVPGCTRYQVTPRLAPLGLLMRWWRVKVSSGCPLRR